MTFFWKITAQYYSVLNCGNVCNAIYMLKILGKKRKFFISSLAMTFQKNLSYIYQIFTFFTTCSRHIRISVVSSSVVQTRVPFPNDFTKRFTKKQNT